MLTEQPAQIVLCRRLLPVVAIDDGDVSTVLFEPGEDFWRFRGDARRQVTELRPALRTLEIFCVVQTDMPAVRAAAVQIVDEKQVAFNLIDVKMFVDAKILFHSSIEDGRAALSSRIATGELIERLTRFIEKRIDGATDLRRKARASVDITGIHLNKRGARFDLFKRILS